MKKIIIKIFFTAIFSYCLFGFLKFNIAIAAGLGDAFGGSDSPLANVAQKGGYSEGTTQLSVNYIIGDVVLAALSLIGVVFLCLMVYAGYMWMTARGDEQKVTKAKDTITASIIGIIIVIAAYAISYYVISKLGAGTLQSTTPTPAAPGG